MHTATEAKAPLERPLFSGKWPSSLLDSFEKLSQDSRKWRSGWTMKVCGFNAVYSSGFNGTLKLRASSQNQYQHELRH